MRAVHPVTPVVSRRAFLRTVAAVAAGAACAGCGGSAEEEASIVQEALRQSAARNSPAATKWAALVPAPRRRPLLLPFDLDQVPGFSRETHRVHWEHHYLEYLWRWENGERELLRRAGELGRLAREGAPSEQLAAQRELVRAIHREMHQGALMVLLHEAYWRDFYSTHMSPPAPLPTPYETPLPGQASWLLLLTQNPKLPVGGLFQLAPAPEGLNRVLVAQGEDFSVPLQTNTKLAVDLMEHAWALDFPDRAAYMEQWLKNAHDNGQPWGARRQEIRLDNPTPYPEAAFRAHNLEQLRVNPPPKPFAEAFPSAFPTLSAWDYEHGLALAAGANGFVCVLEVTQMPPAILLVPDEDVPNGLPSVMVAAWRGGEALP